MINQVLAFQRVVGAYPALVLVGEGVIGQVLAVALGVDARAIQERDLGHFTATGYEPD